MTEYLNKSFSVCVGGDQDYRDRWEATFGKKCTCSTKVKMGLSYHRDGCPLGDRPDHVEPPEATEEDS